MAAPSTLPQHAASRKSPIDRSAVLTLTGYGIEIRMQSGHLEIEDGIGPERRKIRLPRVGHGLKRLVCISEDGFTTLGALKWLSDLGVPFLMLNRKGRVLFVTGPTAPSDVRLRRAQALAHHSGAALRIARELIDKKLAGQEQVARHKLFAEDCAEAIKRYRSDLAEIDSLERVLLVESRAAALYWSAWRTLPIVFPRRDEARLPAHWRVFGARVSPLTGSPRVAVNPPNAMLNFLYCLLESESRLAAVALGLDPQLGILHVDTKARDSLACDLMEAVRWRVDVFVLDWVMREPLKREWFFEQQDGNCRLVASFAAQLSQTAPMWARAVAPFAEWVARTLWSKASKPTRNERPPTPLTQRHRREAKDAQSFPPAERPFRPETLCRGCGKNIRTGRIHCGQCAIEGATQRLEAAARIGRLVSHTPEARTKQSATRRRHARACSEWDPSTQPAWLTDEVFTNKIQPRLSTFSTSTIARGIGVSRGYAGRIREGYRPHPRHWQALAELVETF
jgi:CRISPR-associated endonuclease Cas1